MHRCGGCMMPLLTAAVIPDAASLLLFANAACGTLEFQNDGGSLQALQLPAS